jgi:hypothetical protein
MFLIVTLTALTVLTQELVCDEQIGSKTASETTITNTTDSSSTSNAADTSSSAIIQATCSQVRKCLATFTAAAVATAAATAAGVQPFFRTTICVWGFLIQMELPGCPSYRTMDLWSSVNLTAVILPAAVTKVVWLGVLLCGP